MQLNASANGVCCFHLMKFHCKNKITKGEFNEQAIFIR